MDTLLRDVQYAVRQLRRGRTSTLIALLTVAVGIAVTTVMLSVVDVVLLRPLAYRNENRLVTIELTTAKNRDHVQHGALLPYDLYRTLKSDAPLATKSVEEFAAWTNDFAMLDMRGELHNRQTLLVTSNLFAFLGARPMLGRGFAVEEEQAGTAPVVVLSNGFWLKNFGGDSSAVGSRIILSDTSYTIVGVMPKAFAIPNIGDKDGEIFIPIGAALGAANPTHVNVLAHLKAGATAFAAQSEIDRVITALPEAARSLGDDLQEYRVAQVRPIRDQLTAEFKRPATLLIAAVVCVFIIICANIAGMQLTRITARRQEFALRATLGASRARIGRLVFVENIALAIAGGTLGIMLAAAIFPVAIALFGSQLPDYGTIGLDLRVLIMVSATVVLMGMFFGAISVAVANSSDNRLSLADGQVGSGVSRQRISLGNAIVIAEISLTMVMLGFTGLLTRSYLQLTHSDRGYDAHGAITTSVTMPDGRSSTPQQQSEFLHTVLASVQQIQGVTYVAASHQAPLTSTRSTTIVVANDAGVEQSFKTQTVDGTTEYLRAVGTVLVRGRPPLDADANQTITIDQAAAKVFFGSTDPVGRTARMKGDSSVLTIVGVVGNISEVYNNAKSERVRSITPHVYTPFAPSSWFTLVVRTNGNVSTTSAAIKRTIHEQFPRAIVEPPAELQANLYRWYEREAVLTKLSVAFALLGLLVAAGGLYAIISYGAAQRIREFGIRMALGAQTTQITALTLQRGAWLAMTGTTIGIAATVALSRVARSLLFEISPTDPQTLVAAGLVLLSVAMLASWIPAWRATKVEVVTALRDY